MCSVRDSCFIFVLNANSKHDKMNILSLTLKLSLLIEAVKIYVLSIFVVYVSIVSKVCHIRSTPSEWIDGFMEDSLYQLILKISIEQSDIIINYN